MSRSAVPSSSNSSVVVAFDPYKHAIQQLEALQAEKKLSIDELQLIQSTPSFDLVVEAVRAAQVKSESERHAVEKFLSSTTHEVLLRLERFAGAINVMAQASEVAALVWGSLRFLVIVCHDDCFLYTWSPVIRLLTMGMRLVGISLTPSRQC